MVNLWKETVGILEDYGKTLEDVYFVCGNDFCISNFEEIAKNTDYDCGFGGQEVASDLKIVGKDWWLERHDYDGSEWWEFKEIPNKPQRVEKIKALVGEYNWSTIEEINREGE